MDNKNELLYDREKTRRLPEDNPNLALNNINFSR